MTSAGSVLFRDVEVDGRRVDVFSDGARIRGIGPNLRCDTVDAAHVIDGRGGALLPGLHDHHIHLLSLAVALDSLDLTGLRGIDALASALQTKTRSDAAATEWVRAIGYHESIAGPLDRHVLDALLPGRPLRVQHRGGALWVLNSCGLDRIAAALDQSADVERDAAGEPTGRLWRYDQRLRERLPRSKPDLSAVGARLKALGITGVTDTTPDLDAGTLRLLGKAVTTGHLPAVMVLGAPDNSALPAGLIGGPRKLMLRDHDLRPDEVYERIAETRSTGRAIAVHCVTREALVLVYAALRDLGSIPGDRIEHAAIVPFELLDHLGRLGVRVVTQPDFIRSRGSDYLRDVEPDDQDGLYRYRSLLAHGIPTAPSSDAPFGALDPWRIIRSATSRRTENGRELGPEERVAARVALDGYLSSPHAPGGPPRRVRSGAPADLVLLHGPLLDVLNDPNASWVRQTFSRTIEAVS
ncbi:MAG: amidohydrolase family protein [Dehalococcoidia bacterium]